MTNLKFLLGISLLFFTTILAKAQDPDFSYIQESKKIVRYFVEAKYDSVYYHFDSNMKQQLQAEYLETIWNQIQQKYGAFELIKASQVLPNDELWMVDVVLGFANQDVSAKITYSAENQIAGLFFTPMNAKSSFYEIPNYADTSKFYEKNIKFGEPSWELEGTLTIPINCKKRPKVVILVPGIGSHDRDLTVGQNKVFKDIAWALASKGIASFRYDKRTYMYKNKMSKMTDVDFDDVIVDDVVASIDMLSKSELVDNKNIIVAGHSFAGYLLPKIIERSKKVSGAIFLAALGRPLTDALLSHYEHVAELDGKVDEKEQEFLRKLKIKINTTKNISKNDQIPPKYLPLGLTASFWKYLDNYNIKLYKDKVTIPLLFVQGSHDYQATEEDWNIWKNLFADNSKCEMVMLEGLDHIFLKTSKNPTAEEYQKFGHVDKSLLDILFKWLNKN